MTDALPSFRYHPDPLRTGSVRVSADECERCGSARGYVYAGPTYALDEIDSICPWCIADGSAADEFDAEFTTVDDAPEGVPDEVLDEVVRRTPGFAGWQQERWLFHCADAAEFVGKAGWAEVSSLPDVVAALLADGWAEDALPSLDAFGDLTAYLFQCHHCGARLAYADAA